MNRFPINSENFGYGGTSVPAGNITYNQNITQYLINATYNTTTNITNNNYYNASNVNATQFDNDNPISIDISWLTDLVNYLISLSGGNQNLSSVLSIGNDATNQNITNVNYINKVGFRNVTTLGDAVIWEIELDG